MKWLLRTLMAVGICGSLWAQADKIVAVYRPAGFLTGEKFLNLNSRERESYAMGFVDALGALSPPGRAVVDKMFPRDCAPGMTSTQVAEIIAQYVQERPGQWHLLVGPLAWIAMENACRVAPPTQ